MSPPTDRKSILQNLRSQIDNGKIIVGAGAGIGLSAKFIEAGGGDLIIIYNSGRYRMAGRGSLAGLMPYGNANDVVLEMVCQMRKKFAPMQLLTIPGWRSPPHRQVHAGFSWSVRDRPVPRYVSLPEATQRPRLRRHPKLSDCRID